jgi:hypothetical protein
MKHLSNRDTPSVWRNLHNQVREYLLLVVLAIYVGTSGFINAISWWFKDGTPEIVVYMDKDAKAPALLPLPETTVVAGERATLWWTVFNKAIDRGQSPHDARYTANSAVDNVYGSPKK